jgi:gamma-D-glutamyl-L-lysine dipeptidyl-peptidase
MSRVICCVPVSPLRAEPSHKTEMVSQQLFGECCDILGTAKDNWVRIRCQYDGYEGWCSESHLTEFDAADYEQGGIAQGGGVHDGIGKGGIALTPEWISEIGYNGDPMMVPLGSSLTGMKSGHADWTKNQVYFKGRAWIPAGAKKDARTIRQLAFTFLNTPYLWGGKSVFGIDCSGFTQTVLKFFDIPLMRDAWQQAGQGEPVGFLQEARMGDLAFFDNADGRITHVGILLNDHEIIHASGKVRVDKIDNMGIIHSENFKRTHSLRLIKRLFPAI